ncbi:MAG: NifB/NifX family molybdenum-iron cluster-binding protein [Desulforhabdus sp.]|jgi:predicted Fe-Mo cluster-binding NifX family protein|nr:NifB/NifX family molybdenum-iron cluster-binding protein [Desulforhabdus sp.]
MQIAISATSNSIDAEIDPRFGRAAFFLLVDPATLEFEAVENVQNLQAAQGAGIQSATLVARHKPAAVLTGNCGPKAFQILQAAGIPVIIGVAGSVRQAVNDFQQGKLVYADAPNVSGHWM